MDVSEKTRDTWILAGAMALIVAASGFASSYASGQAARQLAKMTSEALGPSPRGEATWTTMREGSVLGRVDRRGEPAAYLVVARYADGEFRAAASVDGDGSILELKPLGDSGDAYSKRLAALFSGAVRRGSRADASTLDASLKALVTDTFEALAILERGRTEADDGDR
ncbi:MAG TPA: hypothetical protein PK179_12770 [Spirochaetales bacterium]|nr:hypothetical protein [Spirochaetales bacterium]HPM72136.1 hypothetical protein [Spirochaetales bacterium]